MTLSEVAAELYGLAPDEFVPARRRRADTAKQEGDRQLAAAIAKLRKPTVAAWAVNMLARESPDEIEALLALGIALRRAQRELSGDSLRQLTTQRQQVVHALAQRACELAAGHGHPVGEPALRAVSTTLTAALADPDIAEQVRAGTLSATASYEGFGPAGPDLAAVSGDSAAQATGVTTATRTRPTTETDRKDAERRRTARRELDAARAVCETAKASFVAAEQHATETGNRLREAEEELDRLHAELDAARERYATVRADDRAARSAVRTARVELGRAQRRVRNAENSTDTE